MNTNDLHIDWELLAHKHLSKEATEDEQTALLNWVKASPENKADYLAFKQVFDLADQPKVETEFDVEKVLAQIYSQEEEGETETVEAKTIVHTFYRKVAIAATTIGIAFGLLYFLQEEPTQLNRIVADNIIIDSLIDGSVVTLNKSGIIEYPEVFEDNYRHVSLKQGEAFFDVTHNPEKPFVISSGDISVEVLGTSFNLVYDSIQSELAVTVSSGLVQVFSSICSDTIKVAKGEKVVFNSTKCNNVIETSHIVNDHAWRTRKLVFDDCPLPEVIPQLNKFYDVSMELDSSLHHCRLNAKIEDLSLNDVLSIIELSFDAQIDSVHASSYVISGDGCQ